MCVANITKNISCCVIVVDAIEFLHKIDRTSYIHVGTILIATAEKRY